MTSVISLYVKTNIENDTFLEFSSFSDEITQKIEGQIKHNNLLLYGVIGRFQSADFMNRRKFKEYVEALKLTENNPGIQAINVIKIVKKNYVAAYEKQAQKEGFLEFRITPSGEREFYTPIQYIEPFTEKNKLALGFDTNSNSSRQKAQNQATDTGQIILSSKVKLLQDNSQFNVIAIAALYQKGMPTNTIEERRKALDGFVTTPYNMNAFFNELFSKEFASSISIKVFDQNKDNLGNLIFKSSNTRESQRSSLVMQTRVLKFNDGNQWVLEINSDKTSDLFKYTPAWIILISGFTISFLLYFLIKAQSMMRFNAQKIANQLTQDNRQLNQRLMLALNSAKMGVWELNPINGNLIWDQKQFELFDIDQNEFTEQLDDWKACIHPDDIEKSATDLEKALTGEKDFDTLFRVITKNKSVKYIKGQAIVLRNKSNQPIKMIGVNYDITEFITNQQNLTQAKDLAEVANLAKSRFLAKMSHEIRTPLNGIIGLSQLALNSNISSESKDFFVKIFASSKVLLKTLNEILEFSKIEAGRFELENEIFMIDQLLQEVFDLYNPSAQLKNIHLILEHDQQIPQFLKGDINSIKQIIHNLLDNAIKFSNTGSIILKTKFNKQIDQMVDFEISIQNSGIGINETDLPFITRPFTQANHSISKNFGGTG